VSNCTIDADFINKWKVCYDEDNIGCDEEDYIKIRDKVVEEVSRGSLSKCTFIEILNWKTPRLKGIVRLDEFSYYDAGIKNALKAPEDQKLLILDELYGIGVPTASTILHLIYPSRFPIMDIRIAESLHYFNLLERYQECQEL
jgi:hypothetical protein